MPRRTRFASVNSVSVMATGRQLNGAAEEHPSETLLPSVWRVPLPSSETKASVLESSEGLCREMRRAGAEDQERRWEGE